MRDHVVKGLDVHCVEEALTGVIVVKLKSAKDLKCMVSVFDTSLWVRAGATLPK